MSCYVNDIESIFKILDYIASGFRDESTLNVEYARCRTFRHIENVDHMVDNPNFDFRSISCDVFYSGKRFDYNLTTQNRRIVIIGKPISIDSADEAERELSLAAFKSLCIPKR